MYLKTSTLNSWIIDKYFKDKDLISIEELIGKLEEVDADMERYKEQLEDTIEDRDENYKRKSVKEQINE